MRITTHKRQLPHGYWVYYCIVHQGDFIRDSDSMPLRFATRSKACNYRRVLRTQATFQEAQPNA